MDPSNTLKKKSPGYAVAVQNLELVAKTIRGLSIDGVETAKSGHPGLPLGAASLAAYLYGHFLHHYPKVSTWFARDRFVLSAGHGSMLLYSCLHLSGFNLPLKEIQRFRQLHSKTPGHPEYGHTDGVETTTGPLGQGLAAAVGQAMGLQLNQAHLQLPKELYSPKVIALVGDGCMMEGLSHESGSLAGHLQLDNLIVLYDANQVCLDGPLDECCSEQVHKRFEAYGWHVETIDGHNMEQIHEVLMRARGIQTQPWLIVAKTTIGFGSPHKSGSCEAHGSPLGKEEALLTKQALGISEEPFFIPEEVKVFFDERLQQQKKQYQIWLEDFEKWKKVNPELAKKFENHLTRTMPDDLEASLQALNMPPSAASRASSNLVIQHLTARLSWIVGGSADLSCSDSTWIKQFDRVAPRAWKGRNIKFGVREFAMAVAASGIFQSQTWTPFVGTFLTFSDYMRNAVRLSAMMPTQVIYQFTHDSVFLGEDGPTHQPIEHYIALRAIPGLQVIRPGDAHEVAMAWLAALKYKGPTALILSRQALPLLESTKRSYVEGLGKGAYIVHEPTMLHGVIMATGSELSLAIDVAKQLQTKGFGVRVVSMPCWKLFEEQDATYRNNILGPRGIWRISLEAGSTLGWHKYLGDFGLAIGIDSFGQSAPLADLKEFFGFNTEAIATRISNFVESLDGQR